ncbi:MAG: PIN domain-containing protein [Hyphomicrobiaceae bacterium]|nr:PIN domain-containing protein [Hyphomicrobiaceae bacterium]
MTILDTSLLIPLVRSKGNGYASRLAAAISDMDVFLTSVSEVKLLQGTRDEVEWNLILGVLARQDILHPAPSAWRLAARAYFDLRRQGKTVRSILDCLVAEIAIERGMPLLHLDRDFETIATVRPLKQRRLEIPEGL